MRTEQTGAIQAEAAMNRLQQLYHQLEARGLTGEQRRVIEHELALAGQVTLAAACLQHGRLAPLLCAPVFGRCLPILLAAVAPPNPKASLGALLAAAPQAPALFIAVAGLGAHAVSVRASDLSPE